MRKLASIQRIKTLEPIENAEAIEKATVLGWQLVVKKNEFKPGDLCVYCEIDSLFPDKSEFEFLKPRGMRIRTIRLRGQISQGICFPLTILPAACGISEDADVTEILGITKYEPPIPACLAGKVKGKFPSFIPKTDEVRIQVLENILAIYKDEPCYVTEKIDGSSVTYYMNEGVFGVCSRNLELLEDDENSLWKVARAYKIEEKLLTMEGNYALQGEIMGEGIQSNKLKLRGQHVFFFNVFDISKREYLSFSDFEKFIAEMDLKTVPVIEKDYILSNSIEELVKKSVRKSLIAPDVWAEGIVIRPLKEKSDFSKEAKDLFNGRVSFKVVNPEFLIKYGE
ncbi:MAG: RNA ligase [Bacteroidetes bacterium RIFOXYA12_FULL_35_11]|nr:MAG: RNA ligase [Bacteroidetes bacterium GWF2_35_48]OFY82699.1 MAG: RNA ligase [Bacteroidetes bacterium RIFOXYA12_FULL_35_11]OFY93499.1 MAG: RNA ligase [Bacteroidetes bacterium RIFOXYB2_FULL_35_7]OFY95027.1 MAG: RNA ligase [Bacteroidetes bacterium RIFOXYC12_FULL_35_7]HBX51801.1 RNA ligase (ATP) [Bacteroidales bacterium]